MTSLLSRFMEGSTRRVDDGSCSKRTKAGVHGAALVLHGWRGLIGCYALSRADPGRPNLVDFGVFGGEVTNLT